MTVTRRDVIRYGVLGAVAAALPAQRLLLDRSAVSADPLACAAHRVFTGDVSMPGGFTVPPGEIWLFDPAATTTVTVTGNVVVEGTLRMRPAHAGVTHTIRFEGVNESAFVGGHTMVPLASDVGLWVINQGELDAQGTPRTGWDRAGDDPTWLATDELIRAPQTPWDSTTFAAHTKGAPAPAVTGPDGVLYPTEIANLTRNVRIEGTPTGRAHVMFVGCQRSQTLRHIAIRWMAPTKDTGTTYRSGGVQVPIDANVTGRYGLHFHHCGDGARGTVVEGVVVRGTGGPAFVTHLSNGVTWQDCVAFDVRDAAYVWDSNTETHDVTYDRCAALLVKTVPPFRGYNTTGFTLGEGSGMVARGCVAVGVQANRVNAGGFHWPATANQDRNVWTFEDNVAHNNRGAGMSAWQNDANPHLIERFTSYGNTMGVSHGAYINSYTYRDGVTFGNVSSELDLHSLGSTLFERVKFAGPVAILKHSLPTGSVTRFVDCQITGQVKVDEAGGDPGVFRFESTSPATDLTPDKFTVISRLSTITVVNSDGSTFQVI